MCNFMNISYAIIITEEQNITYKINKEEITMKMTSAQAAKLLRQLKEELSALHLRENNSRCFLASLGEDPESVRPDYARTKKSP